MEKYKRLAGETEFEHKLRLSKAKIIDKVDLEWEEIREILNLDVSADHLRKTAYGLVEYDTYIKQRNGVATRILSISDTHVPFQLPVETFSEYVGCVDILQLNGDIMDCQSISKFPKAYRVSMMEEIIAGRQYLIDLIDFIKPKKVVVTYGNHDLRFQSYLSKNLDSDILELMPQTALDLVINDGFNHYDKRNRAKVWYEPLAKVYTDIEIEYSGNWFTQIGETIFCHPSAFSSKMMETARNAMTYFRNEGYDFKSLVMAHTHRTGQYVVGNTTIFEQGAACNTKQMHYSDGRLTDSQKEGFIYICQDEHGNVLKDKTELVCLN